MYDEQEATNPPIRPEVKIYWLIIGVFIAIAVISLFLNGMSDKWEYIETVVLTITLIVVAWNAYLTRNMQKAMDTQIKVNILPIIKVNLIAAGDTFIAEGKSVAFHASFLELENVGQAVGLNIEIDDIFIKDYSTSTGYFPGEGNPFWFDKILSLSPKEKVKIMGKDVIKKLNGSTYIDSLGYLSPKIAKYDYDLKIRFSDVLGNRYAQIYTIGKSGISAGIVQESKYVPKLVINYN